MRPFLMSALANLNLNVIFFTAIKNIRSNFHRYTLFGILLLVISVSSVITLSLFSTAGNILEQIKNDFGGVFIINRLDNSFMDKFEIEKLSKLPSVKELKYKRYNYSINGSCLYFNNIVYEPDTMQIYKLVFLSGYNKQNENEYEKFKNSLVITDGRLFENDSECVISDEFINEYKKGSFTIALGDIIRIENPDDNINKQYIITGIVDDQILTGQEVNKNFIYTTMEGAEGLKNKEITTHNIGNGSFTEGYDALYYLHSYKDFEKFKSELDELNKKSDHDKYIGQYAKDGFYDLINPLENAQLVYTLLLSIIMIIGIILIIIMTAININERKYDIGVLRCIGMSKMRIISVFTLETLLFILTVMLVGLAAGSLLSGFFTGRLNAGDYNADSLFILAQTGVSVLLGGLALSLLSSFMSAIFILRYQPIKILRNRN